MCSMLKEDRLNGCLLGNRKDSQTASFSSFKWKETWYSYIWRVLKASGAFLGGRHSTEVTFVLLTHGFEYWRWHQLSHNWNIKRCCLVSGRCILNIALWMFLCKHFYLNLWIDWIEPIMNGQRQLKHCIPVAMRDWQGLWECHRAL